VAIGQDTGLAEIRDRASEYLANGLPAAAEPGSVEQVDLLAAYASYLRGLVDLSAIRPLKVVVDAGNGMGGFTVPAVLGDSVLPALPLTIVPLYFELDGSFPNHEANPLEPANIVDLQRAVVTEGADIGIAFDGDADRCFVVDAAGAAVSPSAITALVATRELARAPGSSVIHNLITSHAVAEVVREHGGHPIRTRVGHSFIKAEMARTNAVFGGEHSAHYYFRDFWFADTGMLAAMHVLAALGEQPRTLADITAEFTRYVSSGEINSTVDDQAARIAAVRAAFADDAANVDELDGLTVELPDGSWFNIRASNTEPLLRLNVEGPTQQAMENVRDHALAAIRG
jgi:phosphomannomutase